MNLQQLRYISEVAPQDLNLSRAAQVLHTSQPGVSRQILQLEDVIRRFMKRQARPRPRSLGISPRPALPARAVPNPTPGTR